MPTEAVNRGQTPVLIADNMGNVASMLARALAPKWKGKVEPVGELTRVMRSILAQEEKPRLVLLDLDWPFPNKEPAYQFVHWLRGKNGEAARANSGVQYPSKDLLQTGLCGVVLMANSFAPSNLDSILKHTFNFLKKPYKEEDCCTVFLGVEAEMAWRRQMWLERPAPPDVIGEDPEFLAAFRTARLLAQMPGHIFIYGPPGTGKELLARFIHNASRPSANYRACDVAAIPTESVAFHSFVCGHLKDSWTGATEDRIGILGEAADGTLLIDNLQYAPRKVQAMLLRILQEGAYRRWGETTRDTPLTARIICAVSKDPRLLKKQGKLLPDLYRRFYHHNGLLEIPPVGKRGNDLLLLANHFCTSWKGPANAPFQQAMQLSEGAKKFLLTVDFPWSENVSDISGKVSEACKNAYLDCRTMVEIRDFRFPPPRALSTVPQVPAGNSLEEILAIAERQAIIQALEKSRGNVTAAAEALGIHRSTLHPKLKKYNIE